MSCEKWQERITQSLFEKICANIEASYNMLVREISEIDNVLKSLECYAIAYKDTNMIKSSIKNLNINYSYINLKKLVDDLETLKCNSKTEVFRGVNLYKIHEEVLSKKNRRDMVILVWESKKILQNISYQLERINNSNCTQKKISILKGMIAY